MIKKENIPKRESVANRAGVSQATVSHVINKTKYVSQGLTDRVNEAVEFYNYHPNPLARNFAMQKTKDIIAITNDISNPYYGEIIQHMENIARKHGYIIHLDSCADGIQAHYNELLNKKPAGLFLLNYQGLLSDDQIQILSNSNIAIIDTTVDYAKAMDEAVRIIKENGHKKIAYLLGVHEDIRHILLKKAIIKHDLIVDEDLFIDGFPPYETTYESGKAAMKTLFDKGVEFTTVFVLNDLMAFGAIREIVSRGLRIPEDISLIGCDGIYLCDYYNPPLSTLDVDKKQLAYSAIKKIIDKSNNAESPDKIIINVKFVPRDSIGPANEWYRNR